MASACSWSRSQNATVGSVAMLPLSIMASGTGRPLATQTPTPFEASGSRHSATTTSTRGSSSSVATCSAVVSMCRHASAIFINADRNLPGTSNVIASLSIRFRRHGKAISGLVVMSTGALGAFFGQAFAARPDLRGDPRKSTVPRWSWALDNGRRELRRGPLARTTSRCVPTSFLARLRWLAQFSETLAIAPSALGSAHRLAAKRRTPFSPRAHYKPSIWCWAPRYSRWPRPHELGELHDFYACLTRRYPSSLAIWLATADAACSGAGGALPQGRPHLRTSRAH